MTGVLLFAISLNQKDIGKDTSTPDDSANLKNASTIGDGEIVVQFRSTGHWNILKVLLCPILASFVQMLMISPRDSTKMKVLLSISPKVTPMILSKRPVL